MACNGNNVGTIPDKLQPHSIEAEEAVLGSLLIDSDAIIHLAPFLMPCDFYINRLGWIYEAIKHLYKRRIAIDLLTVCDELKRKQRLGDTGGEVYLTELVAATPTSLHAEHYARIVKRNAIKRRLIDTAGAISRLAYDDQQDNPDALLGEAETLLLEVANQRIENGVKFVSELAQDFYDRIERIHQNGNISGLPTGLTDLDLLTGGLQRSDVVIIAGRPGMGKSALAVQIARYTAKQYGTRSLLFSLEMSSGQLMQRMVAAESSVPTTRLRTARVKDQEWPALLEAQERLARLPIAIDDSGMLTPSQMRSRAIRHQARYGLDLVVVDYIQLMASNRRAQNRHQEVSEISRACKNLARELDIPVIVLSQLNRNVEYTSSKRPTMAHLRESGAIEADADVIMFLYRDEVYNSDTEFPGVAEIILGKHRSGPVGIVSTFFKKETTEFVDLAVERTPLNPVD